MRYLGIDFGSKRVGLALSDQDGRMAFPLSVLPNSIHLVNDIAVLCEGKGVGEIVVGESKDFAQKENPIMKDIAVFVRDIGKATSLPVRMHPEFLTSEEAKRLQGDSDMLDASAAALILQHYIDATRHDHIH